MGVIYVERCSRRQIAKVQAPAVAGRITNQILMFAQQIFTADFSIRNRSAVSHLPKLLSPDPTFPSILLSLNVAQAEAEQSMPCLLAVHAGSSSANPDAAD